MWGHFCVTTHKLSNKSMKLITYPKIQSRAVSELITTSGLKRVEKKKGKTPCCTRSNGKLTEKVEKLNSV